MTNVFVFHGTSGSPNENWFPWLKSELESLDCKVIAPQFPTPENQTLENWLDVFEQYKSSYTKYAILIGQSLGGAFSLRVLERYGIKIKAAYTVGTATSMGAVTEYDGKKDLESFIGQPFNWELIKSRSHRFYVFHSDNDPWSSLAHGQQLAQNLGAESIIVPGAGHFNTKSGYSQFELLLEKIKPHL